MIDLSCTLRLAVLAVMFVSAPNVASAQDKDQDQDARAKKMAQDVLNEGAAIFDTRNAAAMAATYVETGEIVLVKRDSNTNRAEIETVRGRAAIEKAYADVFKDRLPEHKSRNTVVSARFLDPNMLLIHGRFAMNRDQGDSIQFVQIRVREGDSWKIATMQLMELPK